MITRFKLFETNQKNDLEFSPLSKKDFETFIRSYVETAMFVDEYSINYFEIPESIKFLIADDIKHFIDAVKRMSIFDGLDVDELGNNFYYSRNGSGTGFFDGDYKGATDEKTEILEKISEIFGTCYFDVDIVDDTLKSIYYNSFYSFDIAYKLGDLNYLKQLNSDEKKQLKKSDLIYKNPMINKMEILFFMIDDINIEWYEKDWSGKSFIDYLSIDEINILTKRYPDELKNYNKKLLTNKYKI